MIKTPCYKCPDRKVERIQDENGDVRYVSCRSTCQKFKEAQEKKNKAYLERRKKQKADVDFRAFKISSVEKTIRKR